MAVVRVGERALVDAADAVLKAVQQARLIRHVHTTASACQTHVLLAGQQSPPLHWKCSWPKTKCSALAVSFPALRV